MAVVYLRSDTLTGSVHHSAGHNSPLARVAHAEVVAWVAAMRRQGLSASRTRQAYHLLTSMLDDAVKDNRLQRNPAAGVDLPRFPATERRYLTHAQVTELAT